MKNRFEAEKIKPEPIFENTINDIKDNNMKIIASAATNPSAITSFKNKIDMLGMNNISEEGNFKPEPTFEKTIHEIKYNHLKSITYVANNPSAITYFDKNFYLICINKLLSGNSSRNGIPKYMFLKTFSVNTRTIVYNHKWKNIP